MTTKQRPLTAMLFCALRKLFCANSVKVFGESQTMQVAAVFYFHIGTSLVLAAILTSKQFTGNLHTSFSCI